MRRRVVACWPSWGSSKNDGGQIRKVEGRREKIAMWTYTRPFWVWVHPHLSDFQTEKPSSAPQINRVRRAGEAGSNERPLSGLEAVPRLGHVMGLRAIHILHCPFTWHRPATRDIFKPLAYDSEGIRGNFKVTFKVWARIKE